VRRFELINREVHVPGEPYVAIVRSEDTKALNQDYLDPDSYHRIEPPVRPYLNMSFRL
jgi:hypothetical protein